MTVTDEVRLDGIDACYQSVNKLVKNRENRRTNSDVYQRGDSKTIPNFSEFYEANILDFFIFSAPTDYSMNSRCWIKNASVPYNIDESLFGVAVVSWNTPLTLRNRELVYFFSSFKHPLTRVYLCTSRNNLWCVYYTDAKSIQTAYGYISRASATLWSFVKQIGRTRSLSTS